MSASSLYTDIDQTESDPYYDKRSGLTVEDFNERIKKSTTLYVGNLNFYS